MGHDITATNPDAKPFISPWDEELESDRFYKDFDKWLETAYVACLRRNAGDPFHPLIYHLLGVPEFNAGCSGNGDSKQFTRQDILRAIDLSRDEPTVQAALREGSEEVHEFFNMMSGLLGGAKVIHSNHPDAGAQRERGFLQATYDWMVETDNETIEIQFG